MSLTNLSRTSNRWDINSWFIVSSSNWGFGLSVESSSSSAESEYFGATLAAKEGLWLRDLLTDLGVGPPHGTDYDVSRQ